MHAFKSFSLSDTIDGRMLVLVAGLVFTDVCSSAMHENLHGKTSTQLLKELSFRFDEQILASG